jgi:membrane-bound lytic murein transglycosylase B
MLKGKKLYSEHKDLLLRIYNKYGVQPRFILALWGIETSFGTYTGSFNVIRSLSTLSHDLRRREFFTDELINALTIIDQGHITSDEMMGSWAGAMGQNQFMPSSFLNYATDFDKDGKKDIWSTLPDVFASSSNYLKESGWNDDLTWGREVMTTKSIPDNFITTSAKEINISKSLSEWAALGILKKNGEKLPLRDIQAYLVYPEGEEGRKFLVYENFKVIMKWNRSLFFGLSVGILSDMIEYY